MCEGVIYGSVTAVIISGMSYESFVTIVLTALAVMLAVLGVMLAALAIGLGIMALWGYRGMKQQVTKVVGTHVSTAVEKKIQEYPGAAEIVTLFQQLKEQAAFWEEMQKAIEAPLLQWGGSQNDVAIASNSGLNQVVEPGQQPSGIGLEQIKPYPGERKSDVGTSPKSDASGPDTGADNPEPSNDGAR